MNKLPPFVRVERDSIIAETYAAFAGVTREDGVSWSEAFEIDFWKPPEDEQAARQAAARASDLDTDWAQLVEDPDWHGDGETSAWSFWTRSAFAIIFRRQWFDAFGKDGATSRSYFRSRSTKARFETTNLTSGDYWTPVKNVASSGLSDTWS